MRNFLNNTEKLSAFSQNIETCRECIFSLRYADITNYIGLSESTMISYDTKGVAPYITVADRIAKLYCTSIDRLCGNEILFNKEEVLNLLVLFIQRIGGIPVKLYKEKLLKDISVNVSLSTMDVYEKLIDCFQSMIKDLCRFDKFARIEKDESIVQNFTENFRKLRNNCRLSYRKLSTVLEISIGNLCRLEKGSEPMLSSVIAIADFFEITIAELLSPLPNFNYPKIAEALKEKTALSITRPPITQEAIKRDAKLRSDLLTAEQAQKLASRWLNTVNC